MEFHARERIPARNWFMRLICLDWLKSYRYCGLCGYFYGWEWKFGYSERPFPMCACDFHSIGKYRNPIGRGVDDGDFAAAENQYRLMNRL